MHSLSGFCSIRPKHEIPQERLLDWIAQVHARAEERGQLDAQARQTFQSQIRKQLDRLGLGRGKIASRGIHLDDLFQEEWSKMQIYPVEEHPQGHGFAQRSHFYDREVTAIFERFYPEHRDLPHHLIHVTCTGYVAPSPAQKIVSLHSGSQTTVTHAYHMGCYGSIPAIRMGCGFACLPSPSPLKPVDIVHTELCSLHMHPLRHSAEQLLVQSLFADGFIKYTVHASPVASSHLKILALHEEVLPNSSHCMTWCCEDRGLGMTLSKEVPARIAQAIPGYVNRLCHKAGLNDEKVIKEALFALHPGGPRIVQQIQDQLGLQLYQVKHSVDVLRECGNMSSATLPHIWQQMLEDPVAAPQGTPIVSLAFGPGLVISGGLFQKGE